jgi:hypothetical protein
MKLNISKRLKHLVATGLVSVLGLPGASLAQVTKSNLRFEDRPVVVGDIVSLGLSQNGGTFLSGRVQVVSVDASGVRFRVTLINSPSSAHSVGVTGHNSAGTFVPSCNLNVSGPGAKPPQEVLCPTTVVEYRASALQI